jgi:hypothetical protein
MKRGKKEQKGKGAQVAHPFSPNGSAWFALRNETGSLFFTKILSLTLKTLPGRNGQQRLSQALFSWASLAVTKNSPIFVLPNGHSHSGD